MPIEGDSHAIAKVLRAGADVHEDSREVGEALKTALIVAVSHPGSGRVYTTNFFTDAGGKVHPIGSRSPHQASAPGQTPAPDTMKLMNSIDYSTTKLPNGTEVAAGTSSEVGGYLETGTSKMAARPWLRPTFQKMAPKLVAIWAKGIERRERAAARRAGGTG